MASFGENLKQLPKVDDVERIELTDVKGMPAGVIENQPGQSGSLAVYHYLLGKYGDINAAAAGEGSSSTANMPRTRKKIRASTRISIGCCYWC